MQERVAFDVWCLINPDYRQIVKRFIMGSRPDLARDKVAEEVNQHINANKPILLARRKKLRYWTTMNAAKPPWAEELLLYQEGCSPESALAFCEEHALYYSTGNPCPICAGSHK